LLAHVSKFGAKIVKPAHNVLLLQLEDEGVQRVRSLLYSPVDLVSHHGPPASPGICWRLAVYLLRRQANLTLNEVATLACISPPRVSQIQAEVEGKKKISWYNVNVDYKLKH
jgi:hypothetical protein